jgi:hypothetical protein
MPMCTIGEVSQMNGRARQTCVAGARQHGAGADTGPGKAKCRAPTGCDAMRRKNTSPRRRKCYFVSYIVPRPSLVALRALGMPRHQFWSAIGALGIPTRCDSTALGAIRAMPVPRGSTVAITPNHTLPLREQTRPWHSESIDRLLRRGDQLLPGAIQVAVVLPRDARRQFLSSPGMRAQLAVARAIKSKSPNSMQA